MDEEDDKLGLYIAKVSSFSNFDKIKHRLDSIFDEVSDKELIGYRDSVGVSGVIDDVELGESIEDILDSAKEELDDISDFEFDDVDGVGSVNKVVDFPELREAGDYLGIVTNHISGAEDVIGRVSGVKLLKDEPIDIRNLGDVEGNIDKFRDGLPDMDSWLRAKGNKKMSGISKSMDKSDKLSRISDVEGEVKLRSDKASKYNASKGKLINYDDSNGIAEVEVESGSLSARIFLRENEIILE